MATHMTLEMLLTYNCIVVIYVALADVQSKVLISTKVVEKETDECVCV
jgi:hypothetical protein